MAYLMSRKPCLVLFLQDPLPYLLTSSLALTGMKGKQKLIHLPSLTVHGSSIQIRHRGRFVYLLSEVNFCRTKVKRVEDGVVLSHCLLRDSVWAQASLAEGAHEIRRYQESGARRYL